MPPRTRSSTRSPGNIFLFIPNLIGYARVVLALVAFYFAFTNAAVFIVCYSTSALLDLFDGMAARAFNQSTKFGAVLDMVTDRVGTNMLIIVLAVMYPEFYFPLTLLAAGDYASHWVQMYAAALVGAHHKDLSTDRNWLLRKYYSVRPFMFACCVFQETFLIAAYGFYHGIDVFKYVMIVSAPIGGLKQLINIIQLVDASAQIGKVDSASRR